MDLKSLSFLLLMTEVVVMSKYQNDTARNQLVLFSEMTQGPVAIMTTATGAPIDSKQASSTLDTRLIFNEFFMELVTHFNRERIPERVVHAKGGGAFGYFEVTHDITDICKASIFSELEKRTPVAVRFSPTAVEKGGIDTSREVRGFAIKFYTEEGNFDMVGLNTPRFAIKDPILFPSFIRIQKRNPATSLIDPNMLWDFLTLNPETLFMFLLVFGDRGIPNGYRHMPGFSIHTYQVVNEAGESYFVRFHFNPDSDIETLTSEDAKSIAADDPDYANRDLYTAIGNGNLPTWRAAVQVLSMDDVKTAGFDVFDVTRELPLDRYPLRPIGRLVLNKNPLNTFAEIEQLAFNPGNLVPGILGAPDKLFEARRLAYRDTQYYRLGANFLNIPVNCPLQNKAFTYNRDGKSPVDDNLRDIPNYYPNSFNGPVPYKDDIGVELIQIFESSPNNFDQAREVYVNEMTPDEKKRLVQNIVNSLAQVTAQFLKERAVRAFVLVHPDLSNRIREGLENKTRYDYN